MNRNEIQRLAAAGHRLRPEWRADSLETFIGKHLADRPFRDAAVALAWVATDDTATTPDLLRKSGPWWAVAASRTQDQPDGITPRDRCPYHPDQPKACPDCAAYHRRAANRDQVASHMATIRAAIADARTAQASHDHTASVPGCPRCEEAQHAAS